MAQSMRLWYKVGKTEMRVREGRERKRVLVLVARKACKREVVSVPDQDPNRGRGREEGWKARQKGRERARATPTTSPQQSVSPSVLLLRWGIVARDDRSCMQARQGKPREGSDGCSSAGRWCAGVRWATLGAPLRCVREIVRGGRGNVSRRAGER